MAVDCFRYLGFKNLSEVDRLTIPEYELLIEAYQLKMVDDNYHTHWQAFLNFAVQAKKRAGKHKEKPVYRRFENFFDYEKEVSKVKNPKKDKLGRFSGIGKMLRKEGA